MNHSKLQLLTLADMLDHCDSDLFSDPSAHESMARHALLISSFTEGLLKSEEAQRFLRDGLLSSMLRQEARQRQLEPDCDLSTTGPFVDLATGRGMKQINDGAIDLILNQLDHKVVRCVYIPTAMFARRGNDPNSHVDQLQKAREVAMERRGEITSHVASLLGPSVSIHAVTLDLNDGSISNQDGATTSEDYPKDGREALGEWKPNLVYIEGGNTFWLYHCIEKGNWRECIIDAVTGEEAAVYCGKSAGAIIAGATVETATWKEWDDPTIVPGRECYADWKAMEGLNLISGSSIFPHMGVQWSPMIAKNRKQVASPLQCLTDSQVGLFDGLHHQLNVVAARYLSLPQ